MIDSIHDLFDYTNRSLSGHHLLLTTQSKDQKLRETCDQFEAVFTGELFRQMFRESLYLGELKEEDNSGEEKESGAQTIFNDLIREQFAQFVGNQRLLGLSNQLYQQLKPLVLGSKS